MNCQKNKWIVKNGCCIAVIIFLATSPFFLGGCGRKADADMETILVEEAASQSEDRAEQDKDEQDKDEQKRDSSDVKEEQPDEDQSTVFVYVCGCVKAPGVYELGEDARIVQAVEAAGGMTEQAAVSYLNQAQRVEDGLQIYVPSQDEIQSGGMVPATAGGETISGSADSVTGGEKTGADGGKVSLNTASREELMTLTGIGEAKADSILRYRQEHGSFSSVEEIMNIEGIKEGVYHKIKEEITL